MAERLRCITLKSAILVSPSSQPNLARFKNETGKQISIRKVFLSISANGMDAGDSAEVELSQDPTALSSVDQDETRRVVARVRAPESAVGTDGGHVGEKVASFARGQWELEPGEDVHLNKDGAVSGDVLCQIWYHLN